VGVSASPNRTYHAVPICLVGAASDVSQQCQEQLLHPVRHQSRVVPQVGSHQVAVALGQHAGQRGVDPACTCSATSRLRQCHSTTFDTWVMMAALARSATAGVNNSQSDPVLAPAPLKIYNTATHTPA
jgi:hypothetical protein